jgi:4-hydroxy-2-oxoheptanedioate aldolase
MIVNTAKRKMLEGKAALGAVCGLGSPLSAELMAMAGYDFILIDDQHGLWQPESLLAAIRSVRLADSTPMARAQRNDFGQIGALLDRGALGVVVPMVNSVADARAAAHAMRFPPRGGRSFGPYGCSIYGTDYAEWANDEMFLAVQIESKEAVEQVDEIMAVDGVDGCWIGPNDLGRSMGLDLKKPADLEAHQAAMREVLDACKRQGKIPGIAFGPMKQLIEQGYRFVTPGDDLSAVRNASVETLRSLRA